MSTRVARRLAQQPLLDLLPLGYSVRLPEAVATRHDAAHHDAAHYDTAYHDAAQGDPAPAALADPAGPGGEALIAQARRLTEARHPQAGKAWARVTATGQDLPAGVAAEAARARAGELMRADPRAAAAVLLEAAEGFAALGDLDHELEARASVAIAVQLAGDRQQAAEGYATVATQAQAAYAEGKLTPRYYLNVTMVGPLLAVQAREAEPERDPADIAAVAAGLEDVRALAERLSQRYHVGRCHELLAQVRAWQGDADGMAAQLHAAREAFLAEDQPWFAAYPEATLAEHAIHQGNAFAAEKLARDALAHGAGELEAGPRAQLSSLLVVAIGGQQGRDADLADAALTAAGRWEGISEPDTLHNTFIAARAYAQMDRHGEAAALFAQAIPKVDIPYEPAVIAMTRDQYGRSLRAIERHREAAEQFLEAARLVQGDPDNAGPHAMLAALAAEELRASGQEDAALPAFMRAADLLGEAGDVVGRARCLRSAAWLQFDEEEEPAPGTDRSGVPLMRSVLAELEALIAQHDGQHADAGIAEEIDHTRRQLAAMLSAPDDDPEDGAPEDGAAG